MIMLKSSIFLNYSPDKIRHFKVFPTSTEALFLTYKTQVLASFPLFYCLLEKNGDSSFEKKRAIRYMLYVAESFKIASLPVKICQVKNSKLHSNFILFKRKFIQ